MKASKTDVVIRSTDMKPEILERVLTIAGNLITLPDLENRLPDIANKVKNDLEREFSNLHDKTYTPDTWSVAIGKQFSAATDVKRGWFAHIYIRDSISLLVWRTN